VWNPPGVVLLSDITSKMATASVAATEAPLRAVFSGNVLSMLVDEAYALPSNGIGRLFGNISSFTRQSTSDSQEDILHRYSVVSITGYEVGPKGHSSFVHGATATGHSVGDQCVGIFQCRKDGMLAPSFRAVDVTKSLITATTSNEPTSCPSSALILVVNAPFGTNSWILGLSYSLFSVDVTR
jgi:hypothetical protein